MGEGFGMQHVSPTTGAIIISTIPLLTPVFLFVLGVKEKVSLTNFIGIIISFAGIVFVVLSEGGSLSASWKGVSLLFIAVVSAIFFSIILKKVGPKYNSIVIVFWQNLMAVFMFLPFFIIFELNSFINSNHEFISYSAILKLGVFPSTISFVLFIPVITFIGATKANTFTNLIPVITAIFSFFFFGEQFSAIKIIGIITVISGLFISQIKFSNKKIEEVPT
jgi:drug/metabolite transporter (DMT)-like permease